jgi:hypothetical protein
MSAARRPKRYTHEWIRNMCLLSFLRFHAHDGTAFGASNPPKAGSAEARTRERDERRAAVFRERDIEFMLTMLAHYGEQFPCTPPPSH